MIEISRRKALQTAASGALLGLGNIEAIAASQAGATEPPKSIHLPPLQSSSEVKESDPPAPWPPNGRVGYAIVGLGHLALNQILPAFGASLQCKPVALVSGDAAKAREVARQYGIAESSVYDYRTFDRIRENPAVEVVYIVLPNSMHAEFTIRAAQAGKHVLCEKPMATSSADARRMIEACAAARRHLMIAYRIQYERLNRLAYEFTRERRYGKVKLIESSNTQDVGDPTQWRLRRDLAGGGSLPDIGLYCLNTIRYLTGEEPVEVQGHTFSTPGDPRFKEVEEICTWEMRFPSGIQAVCGSSYGSHRSRRYRVHAERGWYGLDPAFDYKGLRAELDYAEGDVEHRANPSREQKDQFALEMDHMAACVRRDQKPYTPGEEGLQDHLIMEAIYASARDGRPVTLPPHSGLDVFRGTKPEA